MLQSVGFQRLGRDLATEQQKQKAYATLVLKGMERKRWSVEIF